MLVLMLMSMLMSHASVDLFVLSFVLPCAYASVASENQALGILRFIGRQRDGKGKKTLYDMCL